VPLEAFTTIFQVGPLTSYDVLSFRVERALGGVAEAVADVHFPEPIDPDDLVGASARFAFGRSAEEHTLDGVVAAVTLEATPQVDDDRGTVHRIHVTSALGLLAHDVDCQIFQDKDVKAIVTDTPTTAAAALRSVEVPPPSAIDYYAMIDASGARAPKPGDSAVFGFRGQAFVTRAYVVGVSGISKGSPKVETIENGFGEPYAWPV